MKIDPIVQEGSPFGNSTQVVTRKKSNRLVCIRLYGVTNILKMTPTNFEASMFTKNLAGKFKNSIPPQLLPRCRLLIIVLISGLFTSVQSLKFIFKVDSQLLGQKFGIKVLKFIKCGKNLPNHDMILISF